MAVTTATAGRQQQPEWLTAGKPATAGKPGTAGISAKVGTPTTAGTPSTVGQGICAVFFCNVNKPIQTNKSPDEISPLHIY